jgi:hypothetical protein
VIQSHPVSWRPRKPSLRCVQPSRRRLQIRALSPVTHKCVCRRMSVVAAMPSGSTSDEAMRTSCGHQRSTERTSTEREQEKRVARHARKDSCKRCKGTCCIASRHHHPNQLSSHSQLQHIGQDKPGVCQPNQDCLVLTTRGLPTHIVWRCLGRATLVCINHTVEPSCASTTLSSDQPHCRATQT